MAAVWFWPAILCVGIPGAMEASNRARAAAQFDAARHNEAEAKVARLLPLLRSEDAQQRREAATSLFTMGAYASTAVSDLILAMQDEDALVRMLAAGAIGHVREAAGPQPIRALNAGLADSDQRVRHCAAIALATVDRTTTESLPMLLETLTALPSDDQFGLWRIQRREAAEALGKMGARAKSALPLLRSIDSEPELHRTVQQAIRQIERSESVSKPD